MLNSLRTGAKSLPMRIFLITLAVGFAMWGIGDVFRAVSTSDSAIRIGDVNVTPLKVAEEFDRSRRTYFPGANNSEAIASGLLNNIVSEMARRALFVAEGERIGLAVTRKMQKDTLGRETAFLDDAGQFSVIRFQDALSRAGLTETRYLEYINDALMRDQVLTALNIGIVYPASISEELARWRLEHRVVAVGNIPVDIDAVPAPGEAELNAWYAENSSGFDSPDLRYVTAAVLSPDVLMEKVTLSDASLNDAYESRIDTYRSPEERKLRQMIFTDAGDADTARSRLDGGEEFTAIAKDMLSLDGDDTDLGTLSRDDLTEELAEAAFSASEGQWAGPVKTALGHHLILVESVTPATVLSLDDVRAELEDELKREQATDLVYQRVASLEDALASGATIEEAAKSSDAELVIIAGMDRNGRDIDGNTLDGIAGDTLFRQSVWTAEPGQDGLVEEANADTFFVLRLDREEEKRPRDLAEVRIRAIEAMRLETAIRNAREKAEMISSATDPKEAARKAGISLETSTPMRRDGVGFDNADARLIANEAFTLEVDETSYIETGRAAIVIMVEAVTPADEDAVRAETERFQANLGESVAQGVEFTLANGLNGIHDIDVNITSVQQLLLGSGN
ncbi:peptidyl-prolyl cis-trans isomerase [Alphaproteobacteria bacterium LSUCC0684]